MKTWSKFPAFVLSVFLFVAGCSVQHYRAAPINSAASAARLEGRSLDDPGLRKFLEKNLGHEISPWPAKRWNLNMLTLAAFYFSPALDAARDRVLEANAAIVTAGARPNPTLSISPGVPSPYLFSSEFLLPIETAGKRGYRIASARNLSEAARLDLANTGWVVRAAVRNALVNALLASRELELLRSQQLVLERQAQLLKQRALAGEISEPVANAAKIQLQTNRLAVQTAEGQMETARAAVAAAVGVPLAGLGEAEFLWQEFGSPPNPDTFSAKEIQREAVVNRLDVRRRLAQYAAAEADLQLEIAKQYPNVSIGPGYAFEESNSYFTVGFSVALPIFNRNQGPIAEAEARRKEAAARFVATQAKVLYESEQAQAAYRAAYQELNAASATLQKLVQTQQKMTEQSVSAGELDRLALTGVEMQAASARQAELDALRRAQTSLGALEDAVQKPLEKGEMEPKAVMVSGTSRGNGAQR